MDQARRLTSLRPNLQPLGNILKGISSKLPHYIALIRLANKDYQKQWKDSQISDIPCESYQSLANQMTLNKDLCPLKDQFEAKEATATVVSESLRSI